MPGKNVLTSQRKKLCTRLRQIDVLIARQERLGLPQFAHIPSFAPQSNPQYKNYIIGLTAQKDWTLAELECLIVSEFPSDYEFAMRTNFRRVIEAPLKSLGSYETLSGRRDLILNTCNLEQNYFETLKLIAARPTVERYRIVNLIKARCLFGTKQFRACRKFINCCLKKKISFPEQKIYYLVQRALCAWQLGKLPSAREDCAVAWDLTKGLSEIESRQRCAVLWFRAQINQALGFTAPAVENLQELVHENTLAPSYIGKISPQGLRFLDEYTAALRKKIK